MKKIKRWFSKHNLIAPWLVAPFHVVFADHLVDNFWWQLVIVLCLSVVTGIFMGVWRYNYIRGDYDEDTIDSNLN